MDTPINILYCGDKNIADGVVLSVMSLLQHTQRTVHVYILTAGLSEGNRVCRPLTAAFGSFLDTLVKKHRTDNAVILKDITSLLAAQPPTANLGTRFTPCCMLRLYADLVEGLPDKLLYLDNDVLCREDFTTLYDHDISGFDLGGVPDYYGRWFFHSRPFGFDYLNSGVLLLNMPRIREQGIFAACRQRCRDKKMLLPDQSAINKVAKKKLFLSRCYNEQHGLRRDTVLQHFTTSFRFFPLFRTVSVKPWQIEKMHKELHLHEYDNLLEEFRHLTQSVAYQNALKED